MDSLQPGSQIALLHEAFDAPEMPTCEYCGEPADELFPVDDSDPSVGYHDTLMLCPTCIETRGRRDDERHPSGCVCADCNDADLTAEND